MEFTANNRGSLVSDIPSDSEVEDGRSGNTFKMGFLSVQDLFLSFLLGTLIFTE